jgi:hypothetical protein
MLVAGCFLSFSSGTNFIPHLGHLPGWTCTTSGCITQVYCMASAFGVCATSADVLVANKKRVKRNLTMTQNAEYLRRFFTGGGFRLVSPCAYLAQQWPPPQHLAPQQSAAGEVAVAVPIMARAVIIIKRYFIEFLLLNSNYISLTIERADANELSSARRRNGWTIESRR